MRGQFEIFLEDLSTPTPPLKVKDGCFAVTHAGDAALVTERGVKTCPALLATPTRT